MNKPLENPSPQPLDSRSGYYVATEAAADEINLVDLWRLLVSQKLLICLVVLISTLTAVVYALIAPPVFRAEALLASAYEEQGGRMSALAGQFGDLASLAGIQLGKSGGSKEQAIAVLKSRTFTAHFIKKHRLMPSLFYRQWNPSTKTWIADGDGRIPDQWAAYKLFNRIRQVSEDKKSGLVKLAVEWHQGAKAAAWVNLMVTELNDVLRQQAIAESEKSIAYLNKQLENIAVVEIQQSVYRLIENQMKNIMLANTRAEFAFRVIDPAVEPQEKSRPNRKMIVILGFMVGLVLAVFAAFFYAWLANLRQQLKTEP